MDKSSIIKELEFIVGQQQWDQAHKIAGLLNARTGVTVNGYRPHKHGIQWQGFYIYTGWDIFNFESETLYTRVGKTTKGRFGRVEQRNYSHAIDTAADLLKVLRDCEPAKE